jgi:purine-binding chemotaxis protein CheW
MKTLLIFTIEKQRFALHLSDVEQIIHCIEIQPLPLAPKHISGTINFHGEFLPVVNLRKLFMLKARETELTDQLIIISTSLMKVALWVDAVGEILSLSDEEVSHSGKIFLDNDFVEGVFNLSDDLVLISDIDKFLTPEQIIRLKKALKQAVKT